MLNFLIKHFPANANYLIVQKTQDEINSFFTEILFNRTQFSHKKDIWGKTSEMLPQWGKQLGWVPDHFALLFLSETVELEIAESLSLKYGKLVANQKDITIARSLLNKLGIPELSSRNPFFLSEGETKLVWLLIQWAKLPQYLIVGNLPTSLSNTRFNIVMDFLINSNEYAQEIGFDESPVIILGCQNKGENWCQKIISSSDWQLLNSWPIFHQIKI